ncbi:TPA: LOW QUALITY PROTEIN: hypothetical protein N0F65_001803, partial [Lagenidium giganteum]
PDRELSPRYRLMIMDGSSNNNHGGGRGNGGNGGNAQRQRRRRGPGNGNSANGSGNQQQQQKEAQHDHVKRLPDQEINDKQKRARRGGRRNRGGNGGANGSAPNTPKAQDATACEEEENHSDSGEVTQKTMDHLSDVMFASLEISAESKRAILEDLKYERLTHVQKDTFSHVLEGKDVLAKAKTGNGKTMAFLLPLVEHLTHMERNSDIIPMLIISPTRELALQIALEARKLTKHHHMNVCCFIGGNNLTKDVKMLTSPTPIDILIATPGRLNDHFGQNSGNITDKVKGLRMLVLDEADRLLDMGFRPEILRIMDRLPRDRQTLLFSATLPDSTAELKKIALRQDYVFVDTIDEDDVQTNVQTKQEYVTCTLEDVIPTVETILTEHMKLPRYKVMVFFPTARTAGYMAQLFSAAGFPDILEMHSRKSQSYRTKTAETFRKGKKVVMFSSDVSARGVDYPDVTLVLQVGLTDRDQYIHRLGRTARAGMQGEGVLVLADFEKTLLNDLSDLPLEKGTQPALVARNQYKTSKILSSIKRGSELERSAQQAYQAWLGFYNTHLKRLRLDKVRLVQIAKAYSESIGLNENKRQGHRDARAARLRRSGHPGATSTPPTWQPEARFTSADTIEVNDCIEQQASTSHLSQTTFASLDISAESKRAILEDLKYERLTHVQKDTFSHVLEGKDVLAKAKTGNGKTMAFLLPLVEHLTHMERNSDIIPMLIISPTRELALQIALEARKLTKHHHMNVCCFIGGNNLTKDVKMLTSPTPIDILIATPGRLNDHFGQNSGNITDKVKGLRMLVLDEADRLLDMGFRPEILRIMDRLPRDRQTLLFSATLPDSTAELKKIALRQDYVFVDTIDEDDVQTNVQTKQEYVTCTLEDVIPTVETILTEHMKLPRYKVMVFFPTARTAGYMAQLFSAAGFPDILEMHSRKSQSYRTKTAETFRKGKKVVMFSSDVSARGVDYPDVTLVLQVGLTDRDQYIHRLGRTARAGMQGEGVLVLADFEKTLLNDLSDLPLEKKSLQANVRRNKLKTSRALATIKRGSDLERSAQQAYQAWLGFYNTHLKRLRLDKIQLAQIARDYSNNIGLNEVPKLEKRTLRKMNLFGVPGIEMAHTRRSNGGSSGEEEVDEEQQALQASGAEDDDEAMLDGADKAAATANGSVDVDKILQHTVKQRGGLEAIAHLVRSSEYVSHIKTIQERLASTDPIYADQLAEGKPEYNLVVTSNDLMVQIDDEIAAIHRYVVEIYSAKFPELDSLVPNALDYVRVVKKIGNEMDMTVVDLSSLLPSATVMGVSVTGSTTSGKPLPADELKRCMDACDELLARDEDKALILRYVESRMKYLAPNVSQLVGTRIAAQIVGLAGGVANLARIPSCNLQVLGQTKKVLSGFSSAAALKHTGVIFNCDLIQNVPQHLRMKACRAVSAKVALMARVDSQPNNTDTEGATGLRFREELIEKMEKWEEPQKAKTKKALPIPDEKPRRKRGGKRYRKIKERLQMTDVRREINRQSFATIDEEYGDNAMGITSGRLGQEGSGQLRILRKEQKHIAKKLKAASYSTAKPALSGLASSLAFTPVQGIELMNPEAAQARVREANKKYFSADSGFVSVVVHAARFAPLSAVIATPRHFSRGSGREGDGGRRGQRGSNQSKPAAGSAAVNETLDEDFEVFDEDGEEFEMEFEEDLDDEDHLFDDDDDWLHDGDDRSPAGRGKKKVEEHVKQKVSIRRAKHTKRRFVDRIRIKATGGHGGNGCASFFNESAMRRRPNGGHGGAGGDVTIIADERIQNLANATHHFKGGHGSNGMPNDAAGRRGKHCFVKVPCGTIVKRVERLRNSSWCFLNLQIWHPDVFIPRGYERETEDGMDYEIVDRMTPVCDLDKHGASFLAATGGKPGLGNRILAGKTTTFGRLRKYMPEGKTLGSPGTSQYYELELKTIADVGLVGYPNAGKSTLLSRLSRATPEIAPYPFTTLHPFVGICEFPDTYRLSVADIPGLIEGAHRNVGLGHDFLRHIERTKVLLYVLDTAGTEGRDPLDDFQHLQRELELYAPNITTRPSLIVANKMDEKGAEKNLLRLRKATDLAVLPILDRLGDGSFGEVIKARNAKTNEIVAIKKMKALFPTWEECLQLRELKSLKLLRHENIITLKEVIREQEELYFVFEYMKSSLFKVMRAANTNDDNGSSSSSSATTGSNSAGNTSTVASSFTEAHIRSIMYQLFCGLAHMHKHGFFHRDIKPENLLCHDETLKIADLGQAREIRSCPPYTDYVATRWYRSPELLLRSPMYNSPIDLWACGCIMAELFIQTPLFAGTSEADQLCRICKVLGTPTKESWPEGINMVAHMQFKFPKCPGVAWKSVIPTASKAALQLISELLQYDPSKRLTASQALQHRYFDQHVPRPMLTTPESHAPTATTQPAVFPLKADFKQSTKTFIGGSKKADEVLSADTATSLRSWGTFKDSAPSDAKKTSERSGVYDAKDRKRCVEEKAELKSLQAQKSSLYVSDSVHMSRKPSANAPEDDVAGSKDHDRRLLSHDSMLKDLLDEFLA